MDMSVSAWSAYINGARPFYKILEVTAATHLALAPKGGARLAG